VKIIYKSFYPFPITLGAFAPWREEFPTPSTFDARLFAQAAQIFNYSNTKSTKERRFKRKAPEGREEFAFHSFRGQPAVAAFSKFTA
jgi:hypothetical protein